MLSLLIEWAAARAVKLAGIGVGVTMLVTSCAFVEHKGVKKERARVVKEATKTDATAAAKRRAAERNPDGMLTRYYRD
mgnify:CR=1 FL=1